MKKEYSTPVVELVQFSYREQVVATSSEICLNQFTNEGTTVCINWTFIRNYLG